jgi:arabinofuranosyltransferase
MAAVSGLETSLFTALVFGAYVAFVEERRNGRRRAGGWAVWCAVATLVRPEGMLIFGLLASYAALGVLRGEPAARLRGALILYAALVAPLFVWRLLYYGSLLPNTFYAKVGYTTAQLARGWRFMYHTVGWTLTPWLLLTAAVLTAIALLVGLRVPGVPAPVAPWTRLLAARPRDEALAVALLLWLGYFVYLWLVGGDYEPTGRFFVPVLALLCLLFQEGLRTFVLLFQEAGASLRAAAVVAAVVGGVACIRQSEHRFSLVLRARGWPQGRLLHHEQLRAVGEWLRDNTPPNARVAVSSIGALSYYADRPILDMMGLTDRHIGRRRIPEMGKGPSGHEKGDGAYVLARKPDVILLDKGHLFPQEVDRDKVFAGARGVSELELIRSAEFARDYELRRAPMGAEVLHYFTLRH